MDETKEATLRKEIEEAINRVSAENGSNTPDFILAEYLLGSLAIFDAAVKAREKWYGREVNPTGYVGDMPVVTLNPVT